MGLYIPNMQMPTGGRILIVFPSGRVLEVSADATQDIFRETQAVPVPPHGRLIDADALAEHKFVRIPKVTINGKGAGSAYRLGWNSAIEAIMENAETIIGEE